MDKYNKNNIHHNKRLSSEMIPSVLDRLYTKDIKKRRQNQIILTQIYTPTFTPFIYTKKENIRKHPNQNPKKMISIKLKHKQIDTITIMRKMNMNQTIIIIIKLQIIIIEDMMMMIMMKKTI